MLKTVTVIGAGLAGAEAAFALAENGIKVRLCEMKPKKFSPAHKHDGFAELVCSNSLKSDSLNTAGGLLKAEMRMFSSLTLQVAEEVAVPAGGALAVDRTAFSNEITRRVKSNPNIETIHGEITEFPDSDTIIATGPLTSDDFANAIAAKLSHERLWFYDAAAPIVTAESVDMNKAFMAARYGKGTADYINCPFTKAEYDVFYNALINAETAPLHGVDNDIKVYEGCMPVEVLAKRGYDALRFGCMKPVGLTSPNLAENERHYAVLQLRKENRDGTMYNIVGFQTNLKFGEQKRVFSLIPGLENAEFVRYGVMHRNTFINSPKLLDRTFKLRDSDNIYFAGQITGVEGYMESAASGIIAGLAMCGRLPDLPAATMMGALSNYISDKSITNFQPMGANMGLLPPLEQRIKNKQLRYEKVAERALQQLKNCINKECAVCE